MITEPERFGRWWQKRNEPNDAAVVAEAIAAGLVVSSGGLLWLTHQGADLIFTHVMEHQP